MNAMSAEDNLESLLPQAKPMVLLSGYTPPQDAHMVDAWVEVSPASPFYEIELGGVPGCVALEYMAQSMALCVGLLRRKNGLKPAIGFVLGSYLAGYDIVRDCMHDETILGYMNKMLYDEVIPTLPLDKKDLEEFATAVQDRFNNPFVNHELMSISLNSTSKWRARNMPTFLDYVKEKKKLPVCLTTSFAAYIAFYSNDIQELTDKGLVCRRPKGNEYTVSDDRWVLEFFLDHGNDSPEDLVHAVMTNKDMWGQDLTEVPGFEAEVIRILKQIRTEGSLAAYKACLA